jgi:hypothetical protein
VAFQPITPGYMTVPLFAYDDLYLAQHQGRGLAFLRTHWYLMAFYIIPWLLQPLIARRFTWRIAWRVMARVRATR